MAFLYENLDFMRENGHGVKIPRYIGENINPRFELRPYQIAAFENFITHYEGEKRPHPLQVLFHMATGSGKTLIMAGLMLYLYQQGYRNFLFFVNLLNIVEKTKDNFLNAASTKYLFADSIMLNGELVPIKAVENFQYADPDAINICFTTVQGLHSDIWMVKENSISLEDFENQKVVLLSDEAHHLNVDTKKKRNSAEEDNHISWENTVRAIFERNAENILLEFTATCDIENPNIRAAYENKIVFDYPLSKFYKDRYSKDIVTFRSDASIMERAIMAVVISQYRMKVFQDNRRAVKPVILFKAAKIADSEAFEEDFINRIKKITGAEIESICAKANNEVMAQVLSYFAENNISFDTLAAEIRDDFSEEHCLSVNNDKDVVDMQIILNSLEDADNPYRAIFEVKKLDEGWDVLNLFDIVRLYETRQSGSKKIAPATIAEAQLIGRGARYYPFRLDDEQPKFQRKYDNDVKSRLRVLETLYYHCQNDHRYITELKRALREIGLNKDNIVQRDYLLKDSFKEENLYKEGKIFLNRRQKKSRASVHNLAPNIRDNIYTFESVIGRTGLDEVMEDGNTQTDAKVEVKTKRLTIREIAATNYAVVHKALLKYPFFKFNTISGYFPNITSIRDFITNEKYLGGVTIEIKSKEEKPSTETLYHAVYYVLEKITSSLSTAKEAYCGTKEFYAENIRNVFKNKSVNYTDPHDGGIGVSQNDSSVKKDWKMDLSEEDWFAYTDNFGTSEEKAFVAYFKDYVDELRKIYDKVFLVRNEREFHIYSFEDGGRFEPDYVLFLQKDKMDGYEQIQIFIEPKGDQLLEKDKWKEDFLLQMQEKAEATIKFVDDNDYRILGFHFFNQEHRMKEMKAEFSALTKKENCDGLMVAEDR